MEMVVQEMLGSFTTGHVQDPGSFQAAFSNSFIIAVKQLVPILQVGKRKKSGDSVTRPAKGEKQAYSAARTEARGL